MNVFLSGTSFDPSYGGPARSVSRLATSLASVGVSVSLWAPDGSAITSPLTKSTDRLTCLDGEVADALEMAGQVDLVHDNGIWLMHNHRLAKFAREQRIPRIVSTRGMLEPKAMHHRRWKKLLAWAAYQKSDLKCAIAHHATAETEANSIARFELRCPISIIPNGVDTPEIDTRPSFQETRGKRLALFIGRIHPIKGLPMLLEAWSKIGNDNWELCIAGPGEEGHEKEIARLIGKLNIASSVTLRGAVDGQEKERLYRKADLFVLPSFTENFGMVVAEALSYAIPVLTTKGTPWQRLDTHQCGWWVEPSADGIRHGLLAAMTATHDERAKMGRRGSEMIARDFDWSSIASKFVNLYESAVTKYA